MDIIPIPPGLLRLCYDHGGETYPSEACGVLSGPTDNFSALTEFHPMDNTLGKLHAADPKNYPRTPREGYVIDALAFVKLEKSLTAEGKKIKVIFHSHVDVGAYFSEEDRIQATWDGNPLHPGLFYLVCGVKNRKSDGAILVGFNDRSRKFEEHPVDPPSDSGAPG